MPVSLVPHVPLVPSAGPIARTPPSATTAPPLDTGDSRSGWLQFAEDIRNRSIPLAADGLPLWDEGTFSNPSARPHPGTSERRRRASLRPQYELLSTDTAVVGTSVGKALRDYGRILWNIRQHQAPRLGLARQIRQECVAALGGPGTPRGREFIRRCKLTGRFTVHLARLQNGALRQFPVREGPVVRQEVENILAVAFYSLIQGKPFEDASQARLQRMVECRIQRRETNWFTFPIFWFWSKFWC